MKLIPDTNFLIYLTRYKLIDELENYDLLILEQVLEELGKLSQSNKLKQEERDICKIIIGWLDTIKCRVNIIDDIEGKADDAVLELARKEKCLVGTMDKELIKRLKKEKVTILMIRQKKWLEVK